jgi:polyprenyl-phospho-N-acetylgalactosaminyl synthase
VNRSLATDPQSHQLWIVIPAFNEGKVIEDVVAELRSAYSNVVVVDDCSCDDTSDRAYTGGAIVLRHIVNLGQGAALQTGIDYALAKGAEFIVTFDADGQHRAEDIEVLRAAQRARSADAVIGSRFLGKAENIPASRVLLLKLAAIYMRFSSGLKMTDAHNGLRLLNRRAATTIRITQNRMSHASEIVNQLGASPLAVVEAPVTVVYTAYSLQKGQKLSNSINILFEMLISKVSR